MAEGNRRIQTASSCVSKSARARRAIAFAINQTLGEQHDKVDPSVNGRHDPFSADRLRQHDGRCRPPDVPAAIAVPTGDKPAITLQGVGLLTYECRAKADAFEWAFTGPNAELRNKSGAPVGKYYGGPTWGRGDGSKVTGKQLAVSPASPGNIPLQLVQANPATGQGALTGVTYIQRVNTQGGVAPADPCNATTLGSNKTVAYSADYVFYK